MRLTVINLFHAADTGFDAGPLEEFCRRNTVRSWVEHFFIDGGLPRLALVLEYEEPSAWGTAKGAPRSGERDFRRDLPPPCRPLYDRLREWRGLRARQDGVPVYVVFTNRELASIAASRPLTKEALGAIEGIGRGKLDKYAADVFTVLASLSQDAAEPHAVDPQAEV